MKFMDTATLRLGMGQMRVERVPGRLERRRQGPAQRAERMGIALPDGEYRFRVASGRRC